MSKKNSAILDNIKTFISQYDYFYILGHERPDGDCIGSQLAMSGLLTTLNKKHVVLSAGPFNDTISKMYQSNFTTNLSTLTTIPKKKAALIFLDAATPERMGEMFSPIYDLPAVVIDHHASIGETFGKVRYIDPSVPANTILVYRLFKHYNIIPTKEQAYYILLGILTDTQFFRFVKEKSPEPFLVAAELVKLGVTPASIYQQISYGYTYLSRKVISKILDRSQRINNNRIILTYISYVDYFHEDDIPQSYEIYQMLEGTHKTEVVVYIQEILNDQNTPICKIGMRSKTIDVGEIAKAWGGGGHPNASGFTIETPLSDTHTLLLEYFDELKI